MCYTRGGNASHGSFHCSLAGQGCRLSGGQSWRGAGVGSIYSLFPLSVPLYFVSLHLCSTNFPPLLSPHCALQCDCYKTQISRYVEGQNTAAHITIYFLLFSILVSNVVVEVLKFFIENMLCEILSKECYES